MSDQATSIEPGQIWVTRDRPARQVKVIRVTPGSHLIPKGSTHHSPPDDVHFSFVESGRPSVCGTTAFRRTYSLVSK